MDGSTFKSVYVARRIEDDKRNSVAIKEFRDRGINGLMRCSITESHITAKPEKILLAYQIYKANFCWFMQATYDQKVYRPENHRFGINMPVLGEKLCLPAAPLRGAVSFRDLEVTEGQLNAIIDLAQLKIISGEGKKGWYAVSILEPEAISILTAAKVNLNTLSAPEGFYSVSAAIAYYDIIDIISLAAMTQHYPLRKEAMMEQDDWHVIVKGELLDRVKKVKRTSLPIDTFISEVDDYESRHKPMDIDDDDTTMVGTTPAPSTVPLPGGDDDEADRSHPSGDPDTPVYIKEYHGLTFSHGTPGKVFGKPSPRHIENAYGPASAVPFEDGRLFPYFPNLLNDDPTFIPRTLLKTHFFRTLGSDRKKAEAHFQQIKKGQSEWNKTARGKALMHMLFIADMAIESGARPYFIIDRNEYLGGVLLGDAFRVHAYNKWVGPQK